MEAMSGSVSSLSIMVVEDEFITLEHLASILAKRFPGVGLYKAHNGSMGLELFKKHSPGIVITDINMPEMGGVQMAVNIQAINPETRFIILTGNSEKMALQGSADKVIEFDHIIVKPVFIRELFDAVEKCIGEIGRNKP
jgi:YesN/AraC family two-component response regulator